MDNIGIMLEHLKCNWNKCERIIEKVKSLFHMDILLDITCLIFWFDDKKIENVKYCKTVAEIPYNCIGLIFILFGIFGCEIFCVVYIQ